MGLGGIIFLERHKEVTFFCDTNYHSLQLFLYSQTKITKSVRGTYLYSPKVTRQEEDNCHHAGNKAAS